MQCVATLKTYNLIQQFPSCQQAYERRNGYKIRNRCRGIVLLKWTLYEKGSEPMELLVTQHRRK